MGSIGIFYEEARNFQTANQYVSSQMVQVVNSATQEANTAFTLNTLNQAAAGVGGGAAYLTDAARSSLVMPFSYSEYNLRPFDQLAGEAATTAGAIYLIVGASTVERRQDASLTQPHIDDRFSCSSSPRSGPACTRPSAASSLWERISSSRSLPISDTISGSRCTTREHRY